jgi:hypothetical protein
VIETEAFEGIVFRKGVNKQKMFVNLQENTMILL